MKIKLNQAELKLQARQLLNVYDASGHSVMVRAGSVWITQEDDPRDVILEAGDAFMIEQPGLTIIEATDPAEIVVEEIASSWLRRLMRGFAKDKRQPSLFAAAH